MTRIMSPIAMTVVLLFVLVLSLGACTAPPTVNVPPTAPTTTDSVAVQEQALNDLAEVEHEEMPSTEEIATGALTGRVLLASGNCMPQMCDKPPCKSSCEREGLATTVYVRKLASNEEMNGVYLERPTPLVATTTSDEDGTFSLQLPVGRYSLFVDDNGREYCNSWDANGLACAFEIQRDQETSYETVVDHAVW